MSLGLQLTVEGQGRTLERFFPRPPVLIGREVTSTHCRIDDPRVSKLHASIDVRAGTICVRDVTSTNGVYVAGRRIEAGPWLPIAAASQSGELRIANWTIRVKTYELDSAPMSAARTLASFVEDEEAASNRGARPAEATRAGVANFEPHISTNPPPPGVTQLVDHTLDIRGRSVVDPAIRELITQIPDQHAAVIAAFQRLYETTGRVLSASPPARRVAMCQQLAASYPVLLTDQSFLALFRYYGWTPSTAQGTPAVSLASAALEAMQDLARWYLGTDRKLADSKDVTAFKDKLRAALDELVIGYVPLVAGLERFEKEMALRREDVSSPRSPVDLAREMVDWSDRTDGPLRRVRAGFADLMMHQVALLNGVMTGVMSLLTELAPTMIEKSAQRRLGRTFFLLRPFRRADPWSVYKERHNDLTSEEHERFRLLFGAEFAEEYRQFKSETRSDDSVPPLADGRAPSLPPPPNPARNPAQPERNTGRR